MRAGAGDVDSGCGEEEEDDDDGDPGRMNQRGVGTESTGRVDNRRLRRGCY